MVFALGMGIVRKRTRDWRGADRVVGNRLILMKFAPFTQEARRSLLRGRRFAVRFVTNQEEAMSFISDLRFAFRSFGRAKGLAITVILTSSFLRLTPVCGAAR